MSANIPATTQDQTHASHCVCLFSALYFPSMGGVENYTRNLANALADRGHTVIIVTSSLDGRVGWEGERTGVEVLRLPAYTFMNGRLPISKKSARYRELFTELEQRPVDEIIINTRFYRHSLEGARFAARKHIVPCVIEHGSAHLTLGNSAADRILQTYEHGITRKLMRYPARFYGVSKQACVWLRHFGIEAEGVLCNAIDAAAFRAQASTRNVRQECGLADTAFIVAFAGRLVSEKGIDVFLEAARLLCHRSDIAFLIAGVGPLLQDVSACDLSSVHALGRLNKPDMAAMLLDAQVLCLPTRSEGFSTVLLECGACGTPPVVTYVGGVDELIPDNQFGCVIADAQPQTIADAISRMANNPEHTRACGCALKQRIEHDFSWEATAISVERMWSGADEVMG